MSHKPPSRGGRALKLGLAGAALLAVVVLLLPRGPSPPEVTASPSHLSLIVTPGVERGRLSIDWAPDLNGDGVPELAVQARTPVDPDLVDLWTTWEVHYTSESHAVQWIDPISGNVVDSVPADRGDRFCFQYRRDGLVCVHAEDSDGSALAECLSPGTCRAETDWRSDLPAGVRAVLPGAPLTLRDGEAEVRRSSDGSQLELVRASDDLLLASVEGSAQDLPGFVLATEQMQNRGSVLLVRHGARHEEASPMELVLTHLALDKSPIGRSGRWALPTQEWGRIFDFAFVGDDAGGVRAIARAQGGKSLPYGIVALRMQADEAGIEVNKLMDAPGDLGLAPLVTVPVGEGLFSAFIGRRRSGPASVPVRVAPLNGEILDIELPFQRSVFSPASGAAPPIPSGHGFLADPSITLLPDLDGDGVEECGLVLTVFEEGEQLTVVTAILSGATGELLRRPDAADDGD